MWQYSCHSIQAHTSSKNPGMLLHFSSSLKSMLNSRRIGVCIRKWLYNLLLITWNSSNTPKVSTGEWLYIHYMKLVLNWLQADYLLGSNPLSMSYMVGYGRKFPRRIHHRGSSLPSIDTHPKHVKCLEGSIFFKSKYPNFNLLTGAIVGGPDINGNYKKIGLIVHNPSQI